MYESESPGEVGVHFSSEEQGLITLLSKEPQDPEVLRKYRTWLERQEDALDPHYGKLRSNRKDTAWVDLQIKVGLLLLVANLREEATEVFDEAFLYVESAKRPDLRQKLIDAMEANR